MIHARRLRVAFGSFVGMTSQALGWAYLQINKTFVNDRLQKWPKDLGRRGQSIDTTKAQGFGPVATP